MRVPCHEEWRDHLDKPQNQEPTSPTPSTIAKLTPNTTGTTSQHQNQTRSEIERNKTTRSPPLQIRSRWCGELSYTSHHRCRKSTSWTETFGFGEKKGGGGFVLLERGQSFLFLRERSFFCGRYNTCLCVQYIYVFRLLQEFSLVQY
jgi:hypothetical protein